MIGFYYVESGYRGNVDWHLNLGSKRIAPYLTVSNGFGLYEAACAGLGISPIITGSCIPFLNYSNLVEVLADKVALNLETYFITRAEELESKLIRQLYECLLSV